MFSDKCTVPWQDLPRSEQLKYPPDKSVWQFPDLNVSLATVKGEWVDLYLTPLN